MRIVYDILINGKVQLCFQMCPSTYDHKVAILITRVVVCSSFHSFHVTFNLPYNVMSTR